MKKQFNEYMKDEAPIQLKVLFHEMDESQAIMLQECFHAFARKVVSDIQSKDGKLPIPVVMPSTLPEPQQWFMEKFDITASRMSLIEHKGNDVVRFIHEYLDDLP